MGSADVISISTMTEPPNPLYEERSRRLALDVADLIGEIFDLFFKLTAPTQLLF
jgi:hypothetical protein